MGHQPGWYRLISAARYLGCDPWDLLAQPVYWTDWAHAAMQAEYEGSQPAEQL